MSLILATGSNLGDRKKNLELAKEQLDLFFSSLAVSRVFESPAVDYESQPDFYNQLLEYEIPKISPAETIDLILKIEKSLGRIRNKPKGPRIVDIDIIFWGTDSINLTNLIIPHPAWQDRSFIVLPLQELPYFQTLQNSFIIPSNFKNNAKPVL